MAVSVILYWFIETLLLGLLLYFGYPWTLRFLRTCGMVQTNYRGQPIPVGIGLLFPAALLAFFPLAIWEGNLLVFWLQWGCVVLIAYAGWRDDQFGQQEPKGIRGHLALWKRTGQWSNGLWKAAIGFGVAMIVGTLYSGDWWEWILHVGLLVLFLNQINLFDVRPGRAIKGFLLYLVLLLPFFILEMAPGLWLPLVATTLYILPKDIKGSVMLGDTGSNVLGFVLGFWTVLYAPLVLKAVLLALTFGIQWYAEKKSISTLIQQTLFLDWFDRLGRGKARKG